MAKAKNHRKPTKPAERSKKPESDIEKMAKIAAKEALDERDRVELEEESPDQADMDFVDHEFGSEPDEEVSERDIFVDAWKKAQQRGDSARFYIYKNSQFTTIKDYPYSWERLQKEFGEGHFRIVAKSRKSGQNIMVQSELVGDPRPVSEQTEETDATEPVPNTAIDPYAFITMMGQQQERAEAKAANSANAQATMMAGIMQTMMQMQQQAAQQFQLLISQSQQQAQQASQKSQDLITTLLTTMLTKKDDGGFNTATVLKMVQDATRDGESRTKEWFRLVEDKANKLAEEKAELISAQNDGGDGEESLSKTILKGFVPLITQMIQNGPQGAQFAGQNLSPEQVKQLQAHHETERAKQIEAQEHHEARERLRAAKAREAQVAKPVATANGQQAPQPKPTIVPKTVERGVSPVKLKLFEIVKMDIGQALMTGASASKTAEFCLTKLEKAGHARQTVVGTFTLEDFFKLAEMNGVPKEAQPWFAEFHEYLQAKTTTVGVPTGTGTPIRQPSPSI